MQLWIVVVIMRGVKFASSRSMCGGLSCDTAHSPRLNSLRYPTETILNPHTLLKTLQSSPNVQNQSTQWKAKVLIILFGFPQIQSANAEPSPDEGHTVLGVCVLLKWD